jgi:hypothetical protein
MRYLVLAALISLLTACADAPPPAAIAPSPGPEDPAAPASNVPYRPVMAGTAYHGVGSKP